MFFEIKNIVKSFPIESGVFRRRIGAVQALRDVSFELRQGETVALVGGSGCGKSTLAKIMVGLLEADEGKLVWEGQSLGSFSRLEWSRRIQMIFQDPFASLNPKLSVGTQLREAVRMTDESNVTSRCVELLERVGLSPDVLGHYPFQFSGGQRQRIAIARALAINPRLLVADEPLSSLDVTTQAQILDLFGQLRVSCGLTILLITHDLAVAHQFAERVIVLQDGQIVEEGAASVVLKTPKHPYTQALLEAVPHIPC